MHNVLFYDCVPGDLQRHGARREAHSVKFIAAFERGERFLGGAFADPADGALIVFSSDLPAVAEDFAMAEAMIVWARTVFGSWR